MSDLVSWLVWLLYGYTRLLGLKNFEIDFNTGETWTTRSGTIFAALMNILFFSLLPTQIFLYDSSLLRGKVLYQYVFIVMSMIRVVGVFVILVIGWLRRCQTRELVGEIFRIILEKPQLKNIIRSRVICKIICACLAEVLHVYVAYLVYLRFGRQSLLGLILIGISTSIFNLLSAHICLVILAVRARYKLLDADLRQVLEEIHSTRHHKENLANRLNDIAGIQNQLQSLMEKIFQMFGVQVFCVFLTYFFFSISSIHYVYSVYKYGPEVMSLSRFNIVMTIVWGVCYQLDVGLNFLILFDIQNKRTAMIYRISNRKLLTLEFDKRIDAAFESLQLQLTCKPLKFSVLGLFNMDRRTAVSVNNAIIINSILLIQYDIASCAQDRLSMM